MSLGPRLEGCSACSRRVVWKRRAPLARKIVCKDGPQTTVHLVQQALAAQSLGLKWNVVCSQLLAQVVQRPDLVTSAHAHAIAARPRFRVWPARKVDLRLGHDQNPHGAKHVPWEVHATGPLCCTAAPAQEDGVRGLNPGQLDEAKFLLEQASVGLDVCVKRRKRHLHAVRAAVPGTTGCEHTAPWCRFRLFARGGARVGSGSLARHSASTRGAGSKVGKQFVLGREAVSAHLWPRVLTHQGVIERAGVQVRPDSGPKTSHTCGMLAAPAPAPTVSRREEVGGLRRTPSRVSFAI